MSGLISREKAIAKIENAMCEDGFRSGTGLVHKAKVYEIILSLPDAQPNEDKRELTRAINAGIIATNTKDVYSCGMRNGMRWCRALVDDKRPEFEDASQYHVGRWEQGKCSICGGHAPYWAMASTYYQSNYCPECGAKMEISKDD